MENNVTVYVTSTCPFCTMMTNYLTEQKIAYKTINVQENPEEAQRLMEKTGQQGVPQTEVNGQWIIGFDPDNVQKALKE